MLHAVIEDALEVIADLGREFNLGHLLTRQFFGCGSARLLAGDFSLQVRTHFTPRNSLSVRDDRGVSLFGFRVKTAIPFFFFRLFRDCGQDEAVRCCAGALGRGSDPGLKSLGKRIVVVDMVRSGVW